jgi:hypothetical protein
MKYSVDKEQQLAWLYCIGSNVFTSVVHQDGKTYSICRHYIDTDVVIGRWPLQYFDHIDEESIGLVAASFEFSLSLVA